MEISAASVMQLRDKTGVSMMACKKALVESNGDMEQAIVILRKTGEAKAAAKAERTTNEGRIYIAQQQGKASVAILLCETDFVAKNDDFNNLGKMLTQLALEEGIDSAQEKSEGMIKDTILKLGENMSVASLKVIEGNVIGFYLHSNAKMGAVVVMENGTEDQAKDIAMHVTASCPKYLSPADVDQAEVDKEVEIMKAQLQKEKKPEDIWNKILEGKTTKYREENALLTQPFVKDPSMTVEKYLNGAKVVSFERFTV